jgi:hypothetical protein
MKPGSLARKSLWLLGSLIVLLVFTGLDWFPTIKVLNRLKREQRNVALKTRNFSLMAAGFFFPDAKEKLLFARNDSWFFRSLPRVENDAAWLDMALSALAGKARSDHILQALFLASPAPAMDLDLRLTLKGPTAGLDEWLAGQRQEIRQLCRSAAVAGQFDWSSFFSGPAYFGNMRLASRPLAIVLAAPQPALLNFINHISWSDARLEIVRLHLEPGAAISRAWIVCRGDYLTSKDSVWRTVPGESETTAGNLLIDPDSPMLWQPVDPGMVGEALKNELPSTAGRGRN